jgi:hypothetical protein
MGTSYPDWIPSTPALSEEDIQSSLLTGVHYWAIWDHRHDAEMDRRLSAIRPTYEGRVNFRSCNVDRSGNSAFLKNICNIPTLGSYFRGLQFRIKIGLRSETELRRILDEWLAESASEHKDDDRER